MYWQSCEKEKNSQKRVLTNGFLKNQIISLEFSQRSAHGLSNMTYFHCLQQCTHKISTSVFIHIEEE
jgi:hypothetical protein